MAFIEGVSPKVLASFGGFDPDSTLGALQIGVLLSVFLFGILTVQTYLYFQKFPLDTWMFKTLVTVIWIMDLGHTICVSFAVYDSTITLYGHPEKLVKFQSLSAAVLFGGIITLMAQAFFALRIHRIMRTPYIAYLCYLLCFTRILGSLAISVEAFLASSLTAYQKQWGWLVTTLLVLGAVLDVIIAASMCYYVGKNRRTSNNENAQMILDRLMAWTIQTGLATGVTAVSVLLCFQLMPHNFIWLAVYTVLAKLYTNSLLANLNARTKLRKLYPISSSNEGGLSTGTAREPDHLEIPRPMSGHYIPGMHGSGPAIPMHIHRSPIIDKKQYYWDDSSEIGLAR